MRSALGMAVLVTGISISLSAWPDEAGEFRGAKIMLVSRGDVLRIQTGAQEETVMLYGVTCQEAYTPEGARAKRFTERLVQAGPVSIRTRFTQPKVKYIEVRLMDGRVLNHLLLMTGLGKLDTVAAFGDKEYAAHEEQARDQEIGIWRPEDAPPPSLDDPFLNEESPALRFKRRKRLERDAAFELACGQWKATSEAERADVREKVAARLSSAQSEDSAYLDELDEVLESIERELDTVRAETDKTALSIQASHDLEEGEVAALYGEDEELLQLHVRHEQSLDARDIAYDEYGSKSFYYDERVHEIDIDEKLIAKRRAELAGDEEKIRSEHEQRREDMKAQLDTLTGEDEEIVEELDAEDIRYSRAVKEANGRANRYANSQATLDELDAALREGYSPSLTRQSLGTWSGSGTDRTPVFDVHQTVWAVEFGPNAQAEQPQIGITVRREEDGALVVRFANGEFPHESHKILKGPGSFYLDIDADARTRWSLSAIGFTEP